jgi:lipopolysaccharide export system protein LptC
MRARTEDADQRRAVYDGLVMRNRLVAILRIGVPAIGVVVLAGLVLQILVANIGRSFGIGRVSFAGDTVTVDTPTYEGVMANGNVYKVSAETAKATLSALGAIQLTKASLLLRKPDGTEMNARVSAAVFQTIGQTVAMPGIAEVGDSSGTAGRFTDTRVDLQHQRLTTDGPVSISFADGMALAAKSLAYDASSATWTFKSATLTLPALPPVTP